MPLSVHQWSTLQSTSAELRDAGLFDEEQVAEYPKLQELCTIFSELGHSTHPLLSLIKYTPNAPEYFSAAEIAEKKNRSTLFSSIQARVLHPLNAVLEYPASGLQTGEAIGHIFRIDPARILEEFNPKKNIQYSLGGSQGGRESLRAFLLRDFSKDGESPLCSQEKLSCK
jgi:hypothetical protein